jgi:PPK2 family polyphosphate:nucleotide phosphotransferase
VTRTHLTAAGKRVVTNKVTRILSAVEQGDPLAAEQVLPLVYDELRRLAAKKMARKKLGQGLQPTALVHESPCGSWMSLRRNTNPQGCQVFSFKKPSAEELNHNFLWRYMKCLPERGRIGIFNRSYYEDVLVVKVHRELLDHQKLPPGKHGNSFWKARYDDINAFERHLVRNGIVVLKFFLHVSKKEQKRRFLEPLERAEKNWKFSTSDLPEREFWGDYMDAYEDALAATTTEEAPWHVVPADNKWVTRAVVADVITTAIRSLDLRFPEVTDEQRKMLAEAKKKLEEE